MLDHLKDCTPSSYSDSSVASGKDNSFGSKRVPGMKTQDNFAKCTGKKVGEQTKMLIRKQTATLVAAAQLPHIILLSKNHLKDSVQAFVVLGL